MDKFNNQFATHKLRQEVSVTGTGATFTPGTGEQTAPRATKKVVKKKLKPEVKDVEPKLAAGKANIYAKEKWGWTPAPSIPNRPSKGGFIYKQLFEELSDFVNELAQRSGWKLAGGMPKNSKILDYKELWKGKKSSMNEYGANKFNTAGDYKIDGEEVIFKFIRDNKYIFQRIKDGKIIEIDDKNIDKVKELKESLRDIIKQELLNEVTYNKFKKDVKFRNKPDQFHQAIREVRKKVQEINRLFEYVSRLKTELSEGEGGLKYKMHTEKALQKIKEMVSELNQNIKKFK